MGLVADEDGNISAKPAEARIYIADALSVEESVAGPAAIRLVNLLLAHPQWLTSSPLPMTGRNVNLRAGSRALVRTGDRGGGGCGGHESFAGEAEVEVEISSCEVRANDHAQPNISLSLSPSAKSGRGGA